MAAVWSAVLMLEHLGERDGAALLMRALESVARDGPHTPDIGGSGTTRSVGEAIVAAIGA
jgi:tartrate dehydrogenase/decarboxylase/D-malate dehydrogenase